VKVSTQQEKAQYQGLDWPCEDTDWPRQDTDWPGQVTDWPHQDRL